MIVVNTLETKEAGNDSFAWSGDGEKKRATLTKQISKKEWSCIMFSLEQLSEVQQLVYFYIKEHTRYDGSNLADVLYEIDSEHIDVPDDVCSYYYSLPPAQRLEIVGFFIQEVLAHSMTPTT